MMDSITCTNQSNEIGCQPHDSIVRANGDSNVVTCKNIGSQSPQDKVLLPLGPVTPDSCKEIGDVPLNLYSSPLTGTSKPQKTIIFDTDASDSNGLFISTDCSTPKTAGNVVFDPFAPGPEEKMLAPQGKKPTSKLKASVSRRLNFCSSNNDMDNGSSDGILVSDDEIIETVYKSLLKAIVSTTQNEGIPVEVSKVECDSDDGPKTPPLAPRINGIAETCPGAPMKRAGKSKTVDFGGLCRKLQF